MLTEAEIKRFIDDDNASERKQRARVGQRYYEAEHDILQCRLFYYNADGKLVEDLTRSNVRISHPYFMILADQLSAYMMSFKENPIRAKDASNGLQEQLDEYFDDDFWAEIGELVTGAYTKGFEYLFAYQNNRDRLAFQCADSIGVVEIRAADTDDACEHVIRWYIDRIEKGSKVIKRIEVYDAQQVYYYVQENDGEILLDESQKVNPKPHVLYQEEDGGQITYEEFGFIPFFRLDNCKKQFSGLKPIKRIIDDYDIHSCALSNNLIDFDTPLHVVRGYPGDDLDELQQNIKTKKIIGVDDGGGVEVHTVDIPYQARKEKLLMDERDVYIFGMGFDPAMVGDGNITNVVIRSRYTMLELKASKMQTRLQALLDDVVDVVLSEVNSRTGKDYRRADIEYKFTREIMTNETENIANEMVKAQTRQLEVNTILNVATQIGDEEVLKGICDILDLDFDDLKSKMQQAQAQAPSVNEAKAALAAVEPTEPSPAPSEGPAAVPPGAGDLA